MGKKTKVLILLCFFSTFLMVSVNGESNIEINELIVKSKDYDLQQVSIQGEAIGEALERGNYAWVNINDGTNTIGVWFKLEDAKKIKVFGDYKHTGDIVHIIGRFSRDCDEHSGDVDIHPVSFDIVETGDIVTEKIGPLKGAFAITLTIVTLIVAFVYFRVTKRP